MRPARKPIILATVDTYADGDHVGEDSKLAPSDAIVARGWYPAKRRPAKWDNYIQNDIGRRLDNIDMAEALNWPEPSSGMGAIASSGNLAGHMAVSRYAPGFKMHQYHVNNDTKIRVSADGGYSWSDSHTDAGAAIYDIAASDSLLATVATEGGAAKYIAEVAFGGWQTHALTSVTDARCIVEDPYDTDVFYVGGIDTATPRVVKLDCSGPTTTATQTLLSGGGGSARMDLIACGADHILAASTGVASSSNVLRRFARGDASMTAMTQPTSDPILDLLWSDEEQCFYLFTADQVRRSPSGANGTWANKSAGLPASPQFVFRGGAIMGGLIVCATDFPGLLVSGDGAETWDILPDPIARHQNSPQAVCERVCVVGNRLVTMGYQAGGNVNVAYSFRAGRMIP